MWVGAFAPPAAEQSIRLLDRFISDMANDKMPTWFMHALQGADLLAIVKEEATGNAQADHRPVVIPNTLAKVADKAILKEFEEAYVEALMPQQVGVGVKFAAELLVMGLRMTLQLHPDYILISIALRNAFNAIWRAAVCQAHLTHPKLRLLVPYWRAKLGPRSPVWAGEEEFWGEDGLNQGAPSSSAGFSLTIRKWVTEADARLAEHGGCARFGMDDGYMLGPREVIFSVLQDFARGVQDSTGCELVAHKCKAYSRDPTAWSDIQRRGLIPEELSHIKEGVHVNNSGDLLKGLTIFNVPVGDDDYVSACLLDKVRQVEGVTQQYVKDLEMDHPFTYTN